MQNRKTVDDFTFGALLAGVVAYKAEFCQPRPRFIADSSVIAIVYASYTPR